MAMNFLAEAKGFDPNYENSEDKYLKTKHHDPDFVKGAMDPIDNAGVDELIN
jgi:hypothetical protein